MRILTCLFLFFQIIEFVAILGLFICACEILGPEFKGAVVFLIGLGLLVQSVGNIVVFYQIMK